MQPEALVQKIPEYWICDNGQPAEAWITNYIRGRSFRELLNQPGLLEIGGNLGVKELGGGKVSIEELNYSGPDRSQVVYTQKGKPLRVVVSVPSVSPHHLLTYDGLINWHTHPVSSPGLSNYDQQVMISTQALVDNFFRDKDLLKVSDVFYVIYTPVNDHFDWFTFSKN